jgi:hypothetical protein
MTRAFFLTALLLLLGVAAPASRLGAEARKPLQAPAPAPASAADDMRTGPAFVVVYAPAAARCYARRLRRACLCDVPAPAAPPLDVALRGARCAAATRRDATRCACTPASPLLTPAVMRAPAQQHRAV